MRFTHQTARTTSISCESLESPEKSEAVTVEEEAAEDAGADVIAQGGLPDRGEAFGQPEKGAHLDQNEE